MSDPHLLFSIAFVIGVLGLIVMYAIVSFSEPPHGRQLSRHCTCGRDMWHGLCNPANCLMEDIEGKPTPDVLPDFYTTPPHPSRCRNLVKDGPTPCWHPHCDCMTASGPRPRLGADEVLRRHLHSTRKETKRVTPRTET